MRKIGLFLLTLVALVGVLPTCAAELTGVASVNVTSDTSATAKNMAFDEARRQILRETLRQYAMGEQLVPAIAGAKAADLTPLIASSSIDGERISDTTYSANITMTVDRAAARKWMDANGIQNWLSDGTGVGDTFIVTVTLGDAMADWIDLNRIARNEKIDLGTKLIYGKQVTLELPTSARRSFTLALRDGGWKYSAGDGVLRIWR